VTCTDADDLVALVEPRRPSFRHLYQVGLSGKASGSVSFDDLEANHFEFDINS